MKGGDRLPSRQFVFDFVPSHSHHLTRAKSMVHDRWRTLSAWAFCRLPVLEERFEQLFSV
jgi:hypothetical protein